MANYYKNQKRKSSCDKWNGTALDIQDSNNTPYKIKSFNLYYKITKKIQNIKNKTKKTSIQLCFINSKTFSFFKHWFINIF